ncbi:MADS-box transcription factor 33 [Ananas comosus]|uniref:MADS-box transcription factor 33 n=1 Tax=Ananas comosus TaxID=4615 RepID=A0A199VRK0_ANACO|nr:MADS-box transcription factor 33 [Ananas comosus]
MARGKVQMRRIENPVHRQVTFCKRRGGLLKKANELSVLCDAEIGVIMFSANGKLYELATNGITRNMQNLIERYKRIGVEGQAESSEVNQSQVAEQEVFMLKQEIDLLQKGLSLSYTNCISQIQIMAQEIQMLRNKEGILKTANQILQTKIIEQNGLFDVSMMIADAPYPLTISNNQPKVQ